MALRVSPRKNVIGLDQVIWSDCLQDWLLRLDIRLETCYIELLLETLSFIKCLLFIRDVAHASLNVDCR